MGYRQPQRAARVFQCLLLLNSLWGCASYTQRTAEIRHFFLSSQYTAALESLDRSDMRTEDNNRLLYKLERGMILDRMGNTKDSRTALLEADKISDELYTESISKTAASFLVNDSTTDYSGEDFEKVAIHTMLALSFLEDNDLKGAGVEARKINGKLKEINDAYDDQKSKYSEDAFARYLSGMIFEARGDIDSAIIDYRAAIGLFSDQYKEFFEGSVPEELVIAYYRLLKARHRKNDMADVEKKFAAAIQRAGKRDAFHEGWGDLVVIHEVGQIAIKRAAEFFLPINGQLIRFSFPVMDAYAFGSSGNTKVAVHRSGSESRQTYDSTQVQNLTRIAYRVMEDKRGRMVLKQGARLLAKGQITDQIHQKLGPLAGIAANAIAAATETADTRSWTLLPGAFYVTRVRLPPGSYQVEMVNGGRVAGIVTRSVEANKMTFIRAK